MDELTFSPVVEGPSIYPSQNWSFLIIFVLCGISLAWSEIYYALDYISLLYDKK